MNIKKIRKNAVLNVLGMVLPILIFLVLTPIMVEKLGTAGFGVIVIIQSITGYMNFLNIGFGPAIIKQLAENADRNSEQAMRIMWAGLVLFLAAGSVGGVLIYSLAPWLALDLLNIPETLRTESVRAIQIGAAIFLLQMIAAYYRGSALGLNRFDIPNISRILRVILSAIFIIYALESGGGISDVMTATLVGMVIGLLVNGMWMHKACPLYLIKGDMKRTMLDLFHFSKHVFFIKLSGMIVDKLPHLLLGSLSAISNVALYSVPHRIVGSSATIMSRILQVFYPSFSSMDEATKRARIPNILFSVMSIQLFLTTPLILMFILEGSSLLSVWINESFAKDAAPIIFLVSVSLFLRSLASLPYFCALSFNYLSILSGYALLQSLMMIAIGYPLIKFFGLEGAAWSLFLVSLTTITYNYKIVRHLFDRNIFSVLKRPLLVHLFLCSSMTYLYIHLYRSTTWYSPLGVFLLGVLYLLLSLALGGINKMDRNKLLKLVGAVR